MELLAEIRQRGLEPNAITYGAAISVYEEARQPDKELELLAGIQQGGLEPDVITYSAAISACDMAEQPRAVIELFLHDDQRMQLRSDQCTCCPLRRGCRAPYQADQWPPQGAAPAVVSQAPRPVHMQAAR